MSKLRNSRLFEHLGALLRSDLQHEGDFMALAITGETVRRAVALADAHGEEVLRRLKEYEQRLEQLPAPSPERLERAIDERLDSLKAAAQILPSRREEDQVMQIIEGLDETLAVAHAVHRSGRLEKETLLKMSTRVASAVERAAPDLPETWELAHAQQLSYGSDPDIPELTQLWNILADLSPSAHALEAAVAARPVERRVFLVNRAMEILRRHDENLAAVAEGEAQS